MEVFVICVDSQLIDFCNLLRTNDCSALPRIFSGTMASAGFSQFVVTTYFFDFFRTHFFEYIYFKYAREISPGTHTFFSSLPAAFTVNDSVQLLGFVLAGKLALIYGLICDFCSSGQSFAH